MHAVNEIKKMPIIELICSGIRLTYNGIKDAIKVIRSL